MISNSRGADLAHISHDHPALRLLEDPRALYDRSSDEGRRLLNQAIFDRLYIDIDEVTDDQLRPPFIELVSQSCPTATASSQDGQSKKGPQTDGPRAWGTRADLLATALNGGGSSRTAMVEVRGIEPLASSMRPRRSTN